MFKRGAGSLFRSLHQNNAYNFGANEKALKLRMKTISSIGKITKAMKMVAASKMRGDLARLDRGKNFGVKTVQSILANETYLQKKKQGHTVKKTLLVPCTSDRGLCGSINSGIVREVKATVADNRAGYKILVLGEKGTTALLRPCPDILHQSITEISSPLTFPTVSSIAHQIDLAAEDCESVVILYNEFRSAISYVIRRMELLPRKFFIQQFKFVVRHDTSEPEKDWAKHYYFELYMAGQLYHALLNNLASEQSARMNAMENASKNAGEILDKLRLNYNKARQARITMELVEIISGASAL